MVDWKKEIKLSDVVRRKGAAATPAAEAAPPEEAPAQTTPWWKKEIGGGRKAKAPQEATAANVPFWKKEVSLGRRRAPKLEDALAAEEAAVAAFVRPAAPVEFEPVAAPEPEPDVVETAPAPDLEEAYGWLTAEIGPEAAPEPAPPAAVAVPEDTVALAPPEPEAPIESEAPAPAATRPAVPAPLPGVHAPVPASALPPLPAAKKSFLKAEISFRRRPRPPKPAGEEQPARPSTPFWKRELSLGRKAKPAAEAAAPDAPAAPAAPTAEESASAPARVPFWKKELGRSPKKQQPKQAKRAKEPKEPKARRARGATPKGGHRAKKLVGLKVGGSQIAAARVANNGSAQLLQVARQSLDPGIVVGGELRDPDALAEALKLFFKRHKLPKRGVRLGIATNRIGVRSFDLEGIDDPKQLDNAIRFRAQEALPIPIEQAVLDYQILSETPVPDAGPTRRVLLVVAYRELIDRYVDACRKAGIRLAGIDLEAFALLRALGTPRAADEPPADAATVAVAVGYDRSTFAVSDGRVCEFTRVLEWGGFAVNVAVARALDVAPSEAEPVKRALSLDGDEVPEGMTPEQAQAAREAMRKQVGSFARELVSSLQFYQSQPGSLGIAGLSITGGTAHLPGLAEELERLLGVPVAVGDPLARVRVGRRVQADDQLGSYAVAIGLGIED